MTDDRRPTTASILRLSPVLYLKNAALTPFRNGYPSRNWTPMNADNRCPPSSVLRLLSFVLRPPSFVFRRSSFVLRPSSPPFALYLGLLYASGCSAAGVYCP